MLIEWNRNSDRREEHHRTAAGLPHEFRGCAVAVPVAELQRDFLCDVFAVLGFIGLGFVGVFSLGVFSVHLAGGLAAHKLRDR